jgi:hypothetical protein
MTAVETTAKPVSSSAKPAIAKGGAQKLVLETVSEPVGSPARANGVNVTVAV